jgi:hypothetical protein
MLLACVRAATCPTTVRMSVRRRRASLWSVTRICCRMISADVIGRRERPGDPGADVWLSVRAIMGCAPDDSRLGLRPSAFLSRPPMTPPPAAPPLAPAPAMGDDTSPSAAPPPLPLLGAAPEERHDMKKISYAASRSSTGPSASTLPKGQSRSAAAKSSSVMSDRVAVELAEAERERWWRPIILPARPSHRERHPGRARVRWGVWEEDPRPRGLQEK